MKDIEAGRIARHREPSFFQISGTAHCKENFGMFQRILNEETFGHFEINSEKKRYPRFTASVHVIPDYFSFSYHVCKSIKVVVDNFKEVYKSKNFSEGKRGKNKN